MRSPLQFPTTGLSTRLHGRLRARVPARVRDLGRDALPRPPQLPLGRWAGAFPPGLRPERRRRG